MQPFITAAGLVATIFFAFTHPGHENAICTALAGLWGFSHGQGGGFGGGGSDATP